MKQYINMGLYIGTGHGSTGVEEKQEFPEKLKRVSAIMAEMDWV
jgi:hypothetical protein